MQLISNVSQSANVGFMLIGRNIRDRDNIKISSDILNVQV